MFLAEVGDPDRADLSSWQVSGMKATASGCYDLSERAAAQAATRLAPYPGARAIRAVLPGDWVPGRYDLILFSELLYYLTGPKIDTTAALVARDAGEGAQCVLVHFQGDTETDIRPDAARDRFCAALTGLRAIRLIDHDAPAAYDHRTIVLD